jgi:hypothetical protein
MSFDRAVSASTADAWQPIVLQGGQLDSVDPAPVVRHRWQAGGAIRPFLPYECEMSRAIRAITATNDMIPVHAKVLNAACVHGSAGPARVLLRQRVTNRSAMSGRRTDPNEISPTGAPDLGSTSSRANQIDQLRPDEEILPLWRTPSI